MMVFAFMVLLMSALAWWLLRPAWRDAPALATSALPAHLGVLADQYAALDREHATGRLDGEQHRTERTELQRRVLDESRADDGQREDRSGGMRSAQFAVMFAVPLFAIALYTALGNPAALDAQASARSMEAAEADVSPDALQAMLATLAQRLEKSNGNGADALQGWTMLARAYASLQRFDEADRAFARAISLAPNDAQLLADRADVLAMVQGQRTGEPDRLIADALKIDPANLKALALAGTSAFERRDYAQARVHWQKARSLAPAGSEFAASLDRSLIEVGVSGSDSAMAGNAATPTMGGATTSAAPTTATAPARITGRVTLSPALAARAAPTDTVFVFARAANGPRMPLAILRRTVADLPLNFTLDDSLAMSPQSRLSAYDRVIVGARISRSGSALPQPGDLRGESAPIGTNVNDLQLTIDSMQP